MVGKATLCFVDDDVNERNRFTQAFGDRFQVVVGETPEECVETLRSQGRECDLWVLDLYFPKAGVGNTAEQRQEMNERFARVAAAQREFDAFLEGIGQGPVGGLDVLQRVRGLTPSTPAMFLTRKGTLHDSLRCRDAGAVAIVPKPMPATDDASAEALDQAMRDAADTLAERFHQAMAAGQDRSSAGTPGVMIAMTLILGLLAGAMLKHLFL